MKNLILVIFACLNVLHVHAMERPLESNCIARFSVPTNQNPLAYTVAIQVDIINKDRQVILPPIYKNDALCLKELFSQVLNPVVEHTEGPSVFGTVCRTTKFDIAALKKLAAFFNNHNSFTSVSIPEKKNTDKGFFEQIGDLFVAKGHGPTIQFYAPDLENRTSLICFEVELPTKSRYFDTAPIDANHASYFKARLTDLYNMGLENGPSILPIEVLISLSRMQ